MVRFFRAPDGAQVIAGGKNGVGEFRAGCAGNTARDGLGAADPTPLGLANRIGAVPAQRSRRRGNAILFNPLRGNDILSTRDNTPGTKPPILWDFLSLPEF